MAGCPACAAPLGGDEARTCTACGIRLGDPCPACGTVNLPRAQFCAGCGARLVADRSESTPRDDTHPANAERAEVEARLLPDADRGPGVALARALVNQSMARAAGAGGC